MTISEIAKIANVAPATVDRVLHNRGRVSAKTTKLVLDIVNENGFEPNQYARNLRLNKEYKFGVLIKQPVEDGYWQILKDGCDAASKDMKSLTASLIFGYFDDTPQKSFYNVGKELLSQHIDGLILAPNSPAEVERLLPEIQNIPYGFVNTNYDGAKPIIDTSQNCFIAGSTAAKIMLMLRPNGKTFATFRRESISNTAQKRTSSFTDALLNFNGKDITVLDFIVDHSKNIENQISSFIANSPQIDGFFIVNTATYLYMNALERIYPDFLTSPERPAIIGYDAVSKNISLLENQKIDCLISQQPFSQGYNAVHQMYLYQVLGKKEKITVEKHAPVTILFKENIPSYRGTIRERFY